MLKQILDTIESCNLNFLLGSGLSVPYLKTLGQIENLLTGLDQIELPEGTKKLIRCSLYHSFFEGVISRNRNILGDDISAAPVLSNYSNFIKMVGRILLERKSTIRGKEANIFTTNIDIFLERAIERTGLECNDGFSGRFSPYFDLSNFRKAHFKRSLQYDNISELPTINLLKLHGSLTWRLGDDERIFFSPDLNQVRAIQSVVVTPALLLNVVENSTLEVLVQECQGKNADPTVAAFLEAYDGLPIVNPTKAKFRQTILNQTHYELLRIYSNELEKENTLLLVAGFSFADEHIREVTLRAANSNPTLMIYVIAYDTKSKVDIQGRFPARSIRNGNILVDGPEVDKDGKDTFRYDLATINKRVLATILRQIGIDESRPGGQAVPVEG